MYNNFNADLRVLQDSLCLYHNGDKSNAWSIANLAGFIKRQVHKLEESGELAPTYMDFAHILMELTELRDKNPEDEYLGNAVVAVQGICDVLWEKIPEA